MSNEKPPSYDDKDAKNIKQKHTASENNMHVAYSYISCVQTNKPTNICNIRLHTPALEYLCCLK